MKRSQTAVLVLLSLATAACAGFSSRYYETETFAEQPLQPKTVAADLHFYEKGEKFEKKQHRRLNLDYFYEKFLIDNLIAELEKRGWKHVPAERAEYVLNVDAGNGSVTHLFETNANGFSVRESVGEKIISYALYRKKDKKPAILGTLILDGDKPNLEFVNEALAVLSQEIKTENVYQKHFWVCENETSFGVIENDKVKCYMEPVLSKTPLRGREEKTMKVLRVKTIPAP